jgi:hypothetical protein
MMSDLVDWLGEVSGGDFVWYVKRLSGNDTLATGGHQAGPYIPKEFLFRIFPSLNTTSTLNPDMWFDLYIDSHDDARRIRAIYYNNKFHGGTRNEARLTNFGGASSPVLDPDSTGALTVFAFVLDNHREARECKVWVCRNATEEDIVEERIGPVEPGKFIIWTPDSGDIPVGDIASERRGNCWLEESEIPSSWLDTFPSGIEIIRKTIEILPCRSLESDNRLVKRRECEYKIFKSVEEIIELPNIRHGFENIEDFISRAHTILQRRKARSGRSLELHAREIFIEEGLVENRDFSHQPESETGKKPDFIFPSESAYKNPSFPSNKLRMLAVKTTCKDRWRQILNEADRIEKKHLLTLQEGISEAQFREMLTGGVQLIVPSPLVRLYPETVRPHLQTLESFIGDVSLLQR